MNFNIFYPRVLLNLTEFDQYVKLLLEAEGPTGSVSVSFGKLSKMKDFACAAIILTY